KSKLDGERAVLDHPGHLVVRLSWLAGKGPACRPNFLDQLIQRLQENMPIELFEDEWRTPLGTCTAAEVLLLLAQHDIAGILHLGGAEKFSRYQMGLILARLLGKPESLVRATQQNNQATPELRPRDVSLDSSLFQSKFPGCFIPTYEAVLRLELGLGDLVGGTSHQSPATTSPMAT
ncbi:MAG TPA: sugar nucleotide-binding protein, partial [Gemmatales bacterium]|nr:sugar nucleotide-binding protein [Gemmatales bacterium]